MVNNDKKRIKTKMIEAWRKFSGLFSFNREYKISKEEHERARIEMEWFEMKMNKLGLVDLTEDEIKGREIREGEKRRLLSMQLGQRPKNLNNVVYDPQEEYFKRRVGITPQRMGRFANPFLPRDAYDRHKHVKEIENDHKKAIYNNKLVTIMQLGKNIVNGLMEQYVNSLDNDDEFLIGGDSFYYVDPHGAKYILNDKDWIHSNQSKESNLGRVLAIHDNGAIISSPVSDLYVGGDKYDPLIEKLYLQENKEDLPKNLNEILASDGKPPMYLNESNTELFFPLLLANLNLTEWLFVKNLTNDNLMIYPEESDLLGEKKFRVLKPGGVMTFHYNKLFYHDTYYQQYNDRQHPRIKKEK